MPRGDYVPWALRKRLSGGSCYTPRYEPAEPYGGAALWELETHLPERVFKLAERRELVDEPLGRGQ